MKDGSNENLPRVPAEYIESLIKCMGNGKKVKLEVKAELEAHFEDALEGCESGAEKDEAAGRLLEAFGDPETLAKLIKRGKKRCRPLWKKMLVRTGQGLLGLVVFLILYSVWFFTGDPTINFDYLARLNEISKPVVNSQDNAWADYEKAIELYVEPGGDVKKIVYDANWSELSSDQKARLFEWLDKNQQAWQSFVAGSEKSYYFHEYTVIEEPDLSMQVTVVLPNLTAMRDLSKMGVSRSQRHLEEEDVEKAVEASLSVIRCGWHWNGRGILLIEQLIGMGIRRVGYEQVLAIIAEGDLTVDQMRELRGQLFQIGQDGYPHVGLEGERLAFMDTVQHIFTEGGPGGGHMIPNNYFDLMGGVGEEIAYWGVSIVHAGRNRTVVVANKVYDRMGEIVMMSPYQRHGEDTESEFDILKPYNDLRYSLIEMLMPAFGRVSEIRFQGKALFDAVDVVIALKLWELEKGELPGSLAELRDGGFLKEIPDDPYSDGALKYVKRGGDFVLYSVGVDFKDDGGKVHPTGRDWGTDSKGGDRVFWPLDSEEIEISKTKPEPRRDIGR